jgi:hypothetical protein
LVIYEAAGMAWTAPYLHEIARNAGSRVDIPKLFLQECQLTGRHVLAVALHLSQGFGREQMA